MDNLIFINGDAFTRSPKLNDEGKELYLLPQGDLEVRTPFTRRVELPEVSEEPVIVEQKTQVPHLDEKGVQVSYVPTQWDEEQKKQVPVPGAARIYCTTIVVEQVQKTDAEGQELYWHDVADEHVEYVKQAPLEIMQGDERYVEGLEQAFELTPYVPEPLPPAPLTPEQVRLAALEEAQKDLKKDVQINGEKVDATTGTVGDFMDFYFSQTP